MTPFLHTVTITGLDIYTDSLPALAADFPFVEWGILLSESKMGKSARYPPATTITNLLNEHPTLRFAGHLCGRWARDLAEGGDQFCHAHASWLSRFSRVQLNISNILDQVEVHALQQGMVYLQTDKQPKVIIQIGSTNLFLHWQHFSTCDFLFDGSGGKGLLAERWPSPLRHRHLTAACGYAGGLAPDNLTDQLQQIYTAAAGQPVWIDVESGVRTDDVLDSIKVRRFLELAKPYVIPWV